ncbi:MAG: Response regulator UvrY [Deltaproteobacteria bacterium ADurb.BinA179]|jgi:DNA-binding NarL/FixJ family response regulator|nr:response regulator transcription factor [Deltaproteobacteria bacterium]MDI9544056.1 response regulator transcription factor [Pseudomonadota bacterium]NLW67092.1 response regulator transcription factor [Bacteriovoracaceae bacterium]OPZ27118.1 MAG: Response regulator UvrY [Deltaproteobacteria bacterium ADurb.BinA179]HRR19930.1 response regulator transcription factor [Desulfomonilia bacterium]
MPKVLIADDHPIVRTGLKQIIAEEPDIKIIGEASDGNEVLEFLRKEPCDLVLLDLAMPKRSGLEIISEIRQIRPNTAILVLSIYPEDQYAVRALRAGASGYLTKASAPNELIKAMRKVLSGGKYISMSLAEILASEIDQHTQQQPHERLSDREYQVMLMLAAGKTVTEVSRELNLSVKTISTYRARILEKMNMKNNAQMTFYAVENHLLD